MVTPAFVSSLVEVLQPYRGVIYPAFFVGFFLATLVAMLLHRHRAVRSTYVAGFFALLLVVNLAVPAHLLPLMHWHKFSEPRAEELDWPEVRLVDEHGQEIIYDDKATLGVDGVRMEELQQNMREEYSDEKNCEVVRWLLHRASVFRERVQDRPVHRWLRFPPHGLNNQWTAEDLRGYGEFVGLRIYELHVSTSPDGADVTSYSEELVFDSAELEAPGAGCPVDGTTDRSVARP